MQSVPLSQTIITERIVMIRKYVVQLECQRKLAYVMNFMHESPLRLTFPGVEAHYCMWDFFDGRHRLPFSQNPGKPSSSNPTFGLHHKEMQHGFPFNALPPERETNSITLMMGTSIVSL